MKPKYIAIAAITLDGKIAKDKKHLSNWTSREDKIFMRALLDKCDVIIVGNNTYKTAKGPLSKRNCIVFSRSVNKLISKSVKLVYCNPKKVDVKKLIRDRGYKRIAILGGAQTYSYCLKNKMLDELYLTIEPLVFGSGINLFDECILDKKSRPTEILKKFWRVKLISIKKLNRKGSLLLHYNRDQK